MSSSIKETSKVKRRAKKMLAEAKLKFGEESEEYQLLLSEVKALLGK